MVVYQPRKLNLNAIRHRHLAKCPNFHEYNTEEEIQRILALSVPEDNKKKCKEQSEENDGIYKNILFEKKK